MIKQNMIQIKKDVPTIVLGLRYIDSFKLYINDNDISCI